jgi:hypothetical protein
VILIHHGDGGVAQLGTGAGRRAVDRVSECVKDEHQQHGVVPQAAQLLDAETKNVLQASQGHFSCFRRSARLKTMSTGIKTASAAKLVDSAENPSALVKAPTLILMKYVLG